LGSFELQENDDNPFNDILGGKRIISGIFRCQWSSCDAVLVPSDQELNISIAGSENCKGILGCYTRGQWTIDS